MGILRVLRGRDVSSVRIGLGVRYRDEPIIITVSTMPAEVNPEWIFQACNRIDDLQYDLRALTEMASGSSHLAAGLCFIRRQLDANHAPSMSPDDWFELVSDGGVTIVRTTCQPSGWTHTPFPHTAGIR